MFCIALSEWVFHEIHQHLNSRNCHLIEWNIKIMKPLKTFFKMKVDEKHSISCKYKKGANGQTWRRSLASNTLMANAGCGFWKLISNSLTCTEFLKVNFCCFNAWEADLRRLIFLTSMLWLIHAWEADLFFWHRCCYLFINK